jgi:Tfp pilus assembly pilus retraction ATPase PilT
MRTLQETFRKIENGVYLVLGGLGCKKTSTLAHAVAILNLVGHKTLVVAEEDLFLDNFMVKLEEARKSS